MSATSLKPWSHIVYRLLVILVGLSVILSVFAGCAPNTPASPNSAPTAQAAKPTEIKIAMLPIIDALPLYVATKQGYFTANNVNVSFIPAASAAERDQLIAAGQADGMINDLVSVTLYNKQAVQVQTVRFARVRRFKDSHVPGSGRQRQRAEHRRPTWPGCRSACRRGRSSIMSPPACSRKKA